MNQKTNVGIGFCGLLNIVFIVMKLTHLIDWNWLWVFAPLWMYVGLEAVIVLLFLVINKWNR